MKSIAQLQEEYGGYWGECPFAPVRDWEYEVTNGDTRLGYWEWVQGVQRALEDID